MMQDTINSIRVTLNERIGNPFISATIIACVILNWQLSLLLFSDVPYDSKIERILGLYPDSSTRYQNFLFIPICIGAFWTFVWPIIGMVINAYWYWMKANISNVKLWAERKKKLSNADAAELYSMIDAQESRYFEFLKDRQNKIEDLSKQISDLMNERTTLQNETEKYELGKASLESTLSGIQRELSNLEKALSQEKSFPIDYFQKMFNFYMGLGLIKREADGNIGFGERYRYVKDNVLGKASNSPEITVL